ncbi:MAG TPA: tetratricopeptide repeat protein, partial [Clostridia bacterium]|nr:tetratricopeptide repeat protein [Clostridia bacterium]
MFILFAEQDATAALTHFRRATELNPHSAQAWLHMAEAQMVNGDTEAALRAVDRAVQTEPQTPAVAWTAANLLIALGETKRGLSHLRFAMAHDPELIRPALELVHRVQRNPVDAAEDALPPDPVAYFSYMNLLIAHGELDSVRALWMKFVALSKPFKLRYAFGPFEAFLKAGDARMLQHFWNDVERLVPDAARLHTGQNAIRNASFEYDILNGGLDWRNREVSGVLLQNDDSEYHEGRHSLVATFAMEPVGDLGLHQYVVLEPNTQYRFTGYMKPVLESAHGPRFALINITNQSRYFVT